MGKKITFLLAFFLLGVITSWAQVDTYNFASSSGTYTPLATETILWSGTFDENISASITIPGFTMNGIIYNNMYVTSNGFITLGTTAVPGTYYYAPISGNAAFDKVISPFGGDLQNAGSGTPKISYNTNSSGEIVVQWQDVRIYGTNYIGEILSFQVRMNPATGTIRFIYGGTIAGTATVGALQVGLRGTTNADFNNRTNASGWALSNTGSSNGAVCSFSNVLTPTSGLTYTYSICNTITTFPFKESFDGTTFAPNCWTNVNTAGVGVPGTWDRQTVGFNPTCAPHSGAAMARFDSWDYAAGTTGFLATPQMALASDQYEVHFWMYRDNGWAANADLVNVYYNTFPNTAGGTLLGTVHRSSGLSPVVATPNQWYEYVFNMPYGSSGNAFIVFEGVGQYGNSMFIDDVKVKPIFNCPYGSTAEQEPCGSDLNGGCNMPVPAFEPIALGETKCGSAFSSSSLRDTDWYTFTLLHRTDVTLTVNAEFPMQIGFIASPCPQSTFLAYNFGAAYAVTTVNMTLEAGTYTAFVAPSDFSENPCGNENKYWATLTGVSCFVDTFPFRESFDGATFAPPCWVNINTAGPSIPGTWDRQTAGTFPVCSPHTGAAMTRFDSFDYNAGTTGLLVTPQLALPSDQYEVHFWMYRDNGYPTTADRVNVYYNTSQNTTGAILLGTVNRSSILSPVVANTNQWYEYVFTLPPGSSGTAYIVFEGVSAWGNSIFIDDVKVKAIFNCPAVSTAEAEPCGSDLNGGCNMAVPAFEPIAPGQTICGTGWFDGSIRDTDWFTFTLTETTDVTMTVSAEFPVLMGFIASPCPVYSFINYYAGPAVPPVSVTSTLAAGTYYVFVAPDFSTLITCGGEDKYWVKLEMSCPAGSTAEQEACGADLNGGCNMATPTFEPITPGETICGTSWCDGGTRDTDWFIFTLAQRTRVTLTAKAEFPVTIQFIPSGCPAYSYLTFQYGGANTTISTEIVLDPGSYYAWIGPSDWSTIIQCGGADRYWATLTGSTCFEPTVVTASLITATTATISWTAPVPAPVGGYDYEIRSSGAPGSGAAGLAVSGITPAGVLSVAVFGLSPLTNYFAYVRSNCSGNGFSPWSVAGLFSTPFIAGELVIPTTTVLSGESDCYNALETITLGGSPPSFVVFSGGSVTLIAGLSIHFLPGVLVTAGGFMHGYIAPGGPFCVTVPVTKAGLVETKEAAPTVTESALFRIYPNPTTGNFTLEQKGDKQYGKVSVEIYGLRGDRVLTTELQGERKHEFSLSQMPVGLYFIKVIAEDDVETLKLVKTR